MEKDIEKLIEQLTKVRPEMLNEEALKLFNTIMAVLDERDELIKRNKELEDRNKTLNESQVIKIKKIQELEEKIHKEHTLGYSQGVYDCSEAWKETKQEKMEELKKEVKDYKCEENRINLYQRKILQELMGDK